MKEFEDCEILLWQRVDNWWNCSIQSPKIEHIWIFEKAETKDEAWEKCKASWQAEFE